MRVFAAVLTGYMVFAVSAVLLFQLTMHDPHAPATLTFGIASVVWGIYFAGLGGYIAARIAHKPNLMPSVLVGVVIAVGALISLIVEWQSSIWSQVCTLLLMAPATYVGGMLAQRKRKPA